MTTGNATTVNVNVLSTRITTTGLLIPRNDRVSSKIFCAIGARHNVPQRG